MTARTLAPAYSISLEEPSTPTVEDESVDGMIPSYQSLRSYDSN